VGAAVPGVHRKHPNASSAGRKGVKRGLTELTTLAILGTQRLMALANPLDNVNDEKKESDSG
jgi:hypothetical protein